MKSNFTHKKTAMLSGADNRRFLRFRHLGTQYKTKTPSCKRGFGFYEDFFLKFSSFMQYSKQSRTMPLNLKIFSGQSIII